MINIIFLCNWGESPKELLERYKNQTPNESGIWDNIVGVSDIKDADYYIVLEGYNEHLPIEKTIFVKREPNFIRTYKTNYKYIIDWDETNCGITWWVNKTYDELKAMSYPEKTKDVSCVVSSKHKHRADYVKKLFVGQSPIDLYGRGHNKSLYGENYKGPLNYDGKCKLRGLVDYKYSIVLENSKQENYFTEKIADSLLTWTVPLYWGCPNINNILPEGSYHIIDTNHNNPIDEIKTLINNPIDINALTRARNLILDEYNIWEIINKQINKIANGKNKN